MAWLLFLDESGHDHKQMPYEVRGGVALLDSQLWPFTRAMQRLEREAFGGSLAEFQKELKGSTLLDKKRFRFANQAASMETAERQKHCRAFLTKGLQKVNPSSSEFCAYGQACIEMARGMFQLLRDHKAVLFASMIPRGTGKVTGGVSEEYLRKDQVFLLERYFYHLEREKQNGLLVMDAVEKNSDKKFVRQMEAYFVKTTTGRFRTQWIVPTPFFVSSDMAYPVQAADLCIYCINWAFRLPTQGLNEPVREEIRLEFLDWIRDLQFHGDGYRDESLRVGGFATSRTLAVAEGRVRRAHKKRDNAFEATRRQPLGRVSTSSIGQEGEKVKGKPADCDEPGGPIEQKPLHGNSLLPF